MKVKKIGVMAVLAILALSLSGVAIAKLTSDEDRHANVRFVTDDHGGDRPDGVSDDPAGHDAGDDHGGDDSQED